MNPWIYLFLWREFRLTPAEVNRLRPGQVRMLCTVALIGPAGA
jgi:hypothetical protein